MPSGDRQVVAGNWDESKHPRNHGQFSSSPGASGPGGDLHERARASLRDREFATQHHDRLRTAGDEVRAKYPREQHATDAVHNEAQTAIHAEAMRIHAEHEAHGGDVHLQQAAAHARSNAAQWQNADLAGQHAAAMSAIRRESDSRSRGFESHAAEQEHIEAERAKAERAAEDKAIAAGHVSSEARDVVDRYMAGDEARRAAAAQHAETLDRAHSHAADKLAEFNAYSGDDDESLGTDHLDEAQRALHEALGKAEHGGYERDVAHHDAPLHPDDANLIAGERYQPYERDEHNAPYAHRQGLEYVPHPDNSDQELSDEEHAHQLAAHEAWKQRADSVHAEATAAHAAERKRRAEAAQTALEQLHEHQIAAHEHLKASSKEGAKARRAAEARLEELHGLSNEDSDGAGLVNHSAFAHHERDYGTEDNKPEYDDDLHDPQFLTDEHVGHDYENAYRVAETMHRHATSRLENHDSFSGDEAADSLKQSMRDTRDSIKDLAKITGRAPKLPAKKPAKPKKSANRPDSAPGASVWGMATPTRYKLRLTKLDFLSLVDTPAQETAAIRLVKRKGGVDRMEATLHARVVKWTEGDDPLVYCWAFTCTDAQGQPYHDLQGDAITPDFVKAAEAFMAAGGAVDEMHDGAQKSRIAFAYPMDPDIAKAMLGEEAGAAVKQSGLMVAIRPTAEQLAKIRTGEFTGVSIAGAGIRELVKAEKTCPYCGKSGKPNSDGNCPHCGKAMKRLAKVIKEENGKFVLYTHDGKKRLGTHGTRAEAEAQERAIEANKRARPTGLRKEAVLTSAVDGHQHQINLDDPASEWTSNQLTTSYNTSEGADQGHCHAWIYDRETGKITIAEDSGHSHSVDAVVPADVIREAMLNESGNRCPSCGKCCEETCRFCPNCGCSMKGDDDDEQQVVVIAARAPSGISPPAEPTPTVKGDKEPTAMADPNDRIKTLEAENAQLKKMASLTDAHRAHIAKLNEQDQINFLGLTVAQRDTVLAEIEKADEVIYESPRTGKKYRKSTALEIVEAARTADASAAALDQLNIAKREVEFSKRGETVLKNWPRGIKGDLRGRIMKALDKEFTVPAEHEEAEKALRASDFAIEQLTKANGINPHGETNDAPTPLQAFEAAVQDFAKRNNLTYPVALERATATDPEVRRLYDAAQRAGN